jgi:hypothetical protein
MIEEYSRWHWDVAERLCRQKKRPGDGLAKSNGSVIQYTFPEEESVDMGCQASDFASGQAKNHKIDINK